MIFISFRGLWRLLRRNLEEKVPKPGKEITYK
jgi:hypothetical protein